MTLWKATPAVFVTLAGLTAGITLLFLGMRSVMEVGGVCAEGGPYVPRQPCPEGVSGMILAGIHGGLIFLGLYLWAGAKADAPTLAAFAWPALFLTLGWNFFEFGFNPPGDVGIAWSWLFCGVVFLLVGGFPMAVVIPAYRRTVQEEERKRERALRKTLGPVRVAVGEQKHANLVDELERLDDLHRSKRMTDEEYSAAKRKLLKR